MLEGRRILFYVPDGCLATNGVYASQVGGLARYVESLGAKTLVWDDGLHGNFWFFQVVRHFRELARRDARLAAFKPTHVYVRTYQSCLAARELARKTGAKLVYSMRGVDAAEARMGRNLRGYVIAAYAGFCVRKAVKVADHVNSVSRRMAEWIRRRYRRDASVLPCCVAESAFAPLGEAVQSERSAGKTVIYCGGLSAWQKIDEIIALMKGMGELDKTLKFRFLTRDLDLLAEKCKKGGLAADRWTCKACKPAEVPAELAVADCGIILRDDILVNQVASPIKLGEYLAAGCGVIVSPFIGDVAEELSEKSFAKIMNPDMTTAELVAFVRGLSPETRIAAQAYARDRMTYGGGVIHGRSSQCSRELDCVTARVAKVSVVVPNYNKEKYLRRSLESLLRQTCADWEAWIVDDGSTDGSWAVIQDFVRRDARFHALRNERNRGGCFSRNLGARRATGAYLVFLDSDDFLSDDCLEVRLREFAEPGNREKDALVFAMAVVKGGATCRLWLTAAGDWLVRFLRHEIPWQSMMPIWKREAFLRIGGFDETFPRLQDVELHARALLEGVTFALARRTTPDCFYCVEEARMTFGYDGLLMRSLTAIEMFVAKMDALVRERRGGDRRLLSALDETRMVAVRHVGDAYQQGKIDRASFERLDEAVRKVIGRSKALRLYRWCYRHRFNRLKGFNWSFRRLRRLATRCPFGCARAIF